METPEGTPGGGTEYLGGHGAAEQARAGAQVPNDGAPSQQASRLLQGLQEAQRAGGGAENRRRRHGREVEWRRIDVGEKAKMTSASPAGLGLVGL